jgi:hypothetical protein
MRRVLFVLVLLAPAAAGAVVPSCDDLGNCGQVLSTGEWLAGIIIALVAGTVVTSRRDW